MMLLTFGADANKCDEWGNSPLMYAVLNGHSETVTQLVRGGCDVNLVNRANHTALHTAAQNGFEAIVRTLLDAGSNPNICDNNKNSPLLLAASYRFPRVMTMLLDARSNVHYSNMIGRTALHFAALHMYTDITQRLLEGGARPDDPDDLGCTPLTLAVSRNFVPIIHMLMAINCRVDRVVKQTPLFLMALKHGDLYLLQLLVAAGAECTCVQRFLWNNSLPSSVTSNKQLITWLYTVGTNPRSLRDIAAIKVRRCLNHRIEEDAATLPLPQVLIHRVLLRPFLRSSQPRNAYYGREQPTCTKL